jgi:hypothetical protein
MKSRIELLKDLVSFHDPLEAILPPLLSYGWDSEETLYWVTPSDIQRILQRYLHDQLSETQVEEWADALEGRDDIGYKDPPTIMLQEIVFKLSNPLLTQKLEKGWAQSLVDVLEDTKPANQAL